MKRFLKALLLIATIEQNICGFTCAAHNHHEEPYAPASKNSTGKPEDGAVIENRIGLNYEKASAHGTNGGSSSASQQESGAWASGIQGSEGSYKTLSSDARTWGSASSSGSNAPDTWAHTSSNVDKGEASGSSDAGVTGGDGSADTPQ